MGVAVTAFFTAGTPEPQLLTHRKVLPVLLGCESEESLGPCSQRSSGEAGSVLPSPKRECAGARNTSSFFGNTCRFYVQDLSYVLNRMLLMSFELILC